MLAHWIAKFIVKFTKSTDLPHKGERIRAKVVRVYDGDTFTVEYVYRLASLRTNIRLFGVDAPEIMRSSKLEKKAALKVAADLRKRILGKWIQVRFLKHDKYGGRTVADAFYNGSIAKWLLERGYAKEYTGKAKEGWKDAELRRILRS